MTEPANLIDAKEVGMDASLLSKVDEYLQRDIAAGLNFGSSLLVARHGKVVHRAILGVAEPGRPLAPSDVFMQMSMSKAYTAVLVLRAIEAGQFELDTRVAEIIPAFAAHGKDRATIRQLLNHTAGLPSAPVAPPASIATAGHLAEHARAIEKLKPVYEPGTRCAYTSGTGYDMLGQILVETDPQKRSFREIAHQEIFAPLGMTSSSFGFPIDDPRRVPVSATPKSASPTVPVVSKIFNNLGTWAEYPCAGCFGDIQDVLTFAEALAGRGPSNYQLLSPEMFEIARQNTTGDLPLETIMVKGLPTRRQMIKTLGLPRLVKIARAARRAPAKVAFDPTPYPANFTLLGGYTRGTGNIFTPAGRAASPSALVAVGGGSTGWMIDPERDLTVVFMSAGLVEGFEHPRRLQQINDLVIASITD